MRLSAVARKLNVSVSHVRETLEEKGFSIDRNPNSKLGSEMLHILEKEFGSNALLGEESRIELNFESSEQLPQINESIDEILYFREEPIVEAAAKSEPRKNAVKEKIENSFNAKTLNLSGEYLFRIPKELSQLTKLKKLIISKNQIRKIENLPPNLLELDVSDNDLRSLEYLPEKVQHIDARDNKIVKLDNLPSSLLSLNISNNSLKSLSEIPEKLKSFKGSSNALSSFNFSKNLLEVELANNNLEELPNFNVAKRLLTLTLFNNPI